MDTLEAITSRHSTRRFKTDAVDQALLDKVVQAATCAPKGGDMSVVLITCPDMRGGINDAAKYDMLNGSDEFKKQRASLDGYEPLYGAPALILLCAPQHDRFSQVTCGNAATAACIEASSLGLASCFIGSVRGAFKPEYGMLQWLEIPEGHVPQWGVLIGYEDGEAFPVEKHEVAVSSILAGADCGEC